VLVSAVLFETAHIVPGLDELAEACADAGAELLVDAYHALGALPFEVGEQRLESAWVVGGGYKYLQLGEGNCFLRLTPQAESMRPALTGWFAEFELLAAERGETVVGYPSGGGRFAGSTYDPTSHYRAARVFAFFEERGLTSELLRASYLHQTGLLAERFDRLDAPEDLMTRDRSAPLESFGGFLHHDAGGVQLQPGVALALHHAHAQAVLGRGDGARGAGETGADDDQVVFVGVRACVWHAGVARRGEPSVARACARTMAAV